MCFVTGAPTKLTRLDKTILTSLFIHILLVYLQYSADSRVSVWSSREGRHSQAWPSLYSNEYTGTAYEFVTIIPTLSQMMLVGSPRPRPAQSHVAQPRHHTPRMTPGILRPK